MTLKGRRVWDCFPFFNELDLLEIRLNELSGVADFFVLVEAPFTHSGKPKPLHFRDNSARFSAFLDRIVHVVVRDFPPADMAKPGESWKYERHQRDAIGRGLAAAADGDIVVTSDLDEIPRASALEAYDPSMGLVGLNLSLHAYWLNMVNRETEYPWAKVLPQGMARNMTHCQIRYTSGHPILPDGGWHFSFMGGPVEVAAKIEAFAHQEYNIDRCKDPEAIAARMRSGIDPHERAIRYKVEPLGPAYPQHVRDHEEKFSRLIARPAGGPAAAPAPSDAEEPRTEEWNRRVWDAYPWPKDGDEWDAFARRSGTPYESWKDSLCRAFLFPHVRPGVAAMEIGPGHGRWTAVLAPRVGRLTVVDISERCLSYCKERFKDRPNIEYVLAGGGRRLEGAPEQIDFLWSFDTFVHIEEPETEAYLGHFQRVMRRGAMGVVHHPGTPSPDERRNGCRSQMRAETWVKLLRRRKFHVVRQTDAWDGGDVRLNSDAITVFVKP